MRKEMSLRTKLIVRTVVAFVAVVGLLGALTTTGSASSVRVDSRTALLPSALQSALANSSHTGARRPLLATEPYFQGGDSTQQTRTEPAHTFAVGFTIQNGSNTPAAQVLDRGTWKASAAVDPGNSSGFVSVTAFGRNRAVAVGWQEGNTLQPLIEQFDGQQWTLVNGPDVPGGFLIAVDARTASDIYAVGMDSNGALIEHFDGSTWTVLTEPAMPTALLAGIRVLGANNVWAVGGFGNGVSQTLIEHFDGRTWSIVPSPNDGTVRTLLSGIDGRSATNLWAVGYSNITGGYYDDQTLIEHFDGNVWTVVDSPNAGTGNNGLSAVRVLGSGEVWAVGASPQGALVTRLEAGSWKLCGQPTRLGDSNENLYAIADPADDELYAIGGGSDNNGTISYHSFMLHYAGGDWTKLG